MRIYKPNGSNGGNVIYGVTSINGMTGDVMLSKASVGLGNVTDDAQVKRTEMALPNGAATLNTLGKIPIEQLSSQLAHVVASSNKAARLALSNESILLVCLQADTKWMWALNAGLDPSVEANWIDCGSTAASVISINGATGAITISCETLGAVPTSRKVNNKSLTGDITLSLSDILTLPNDPNKFLNSQGQWVNITALSQPEAVEVNWYTYTQSGSDMNHNGGARMWSYDRAYGVALPSGTNHKITKFYYEQDATWQPLSSCTAYVAVYTSANTLRSYGYANNVTCHVGGSITITLVSPVSVSNGDKIFLIMATGTAYPRARSSTSGVRYDSSENNFLSPPASVPNMLTYTQSIPGFYFIMSYVPA